MDRETRGLDHASKADYLSTLSTLRDSTKRHALGPRATVTTVKYNIPQINPKCQHKRVFPHKRIVAGPCGSDLAVHASSRHLVQACTPRPHLDARISTLV